MNSKKKSKIIVFWYIILWGLSVFQYNTILSYSAATAEESAMESRAVADIVSDFLDKCFGSDGSNKDEKQELFIHHLTRKLAHVAIFYMFSFLNAMLFFLASQEDDCMTFVSTLFIGVCGAAFDEYSQLFVEGRAGMFSDVLVDTVGTCGACLTFFILLKVSKYFIRKRVIV